MQAARSITTATGSVGGLEQTGEKPMDGTKKIRFGSVVASALALFLLVSGFQPSGGFGGNLDTASLSYPPAYLDAVQDARVATASEISRNLVAIGPGSNNNSVRLQWDGSPGRSRVLVLTWTNKPYYDNSVGQDYILPQDANLWVTVVPELKSFIADHPREITPLRIEQLLGLPPANGKTKFVEIWVNPGDLFRPSPDPETTDHEAELRFPTSFSRFVTFNDEARVVEWDEEKGADVSYTYRRWYVHRKDTIYSGDYPYPWTRLGYTYDWGDTENHVGLSEFVILGGSTIGIKSIIPNDDYLNVPGQFVH
jgi:hypothetical protein